VSCTLALQTMRTQMLVEFSFNFPHGIPFHLRQACRKFSAPY
jgi:hypothetical protein